MFVDDVDCYNYNSLCLSVESKILKVGKNVSVMIFNVMRQVYTYHLQAK